MSSEEKPPPAKSKLPELELLNPLDEKLDFPEEFTDVFGTKISLSDIAEWDEMGSLGKTRPIVAFQEHEENPLREPVPGKFCFTQLQLLNITHFKHRYIDRELRRGL